MPRAASKKAPAQAQDPGEVFETLKSVFAPYASKLRTIEAGNTYWLISKDATYKGKPMYFGGVRMGKSAASFHLVPVYSNPELLEGVSADLRKQMGGKACFTFKTADRQMVAELKKLTKAGFEKFRERKWV
jgi:hypothetical protein